MTAAVPTQIGELPEKSGYLKLTRGVDGFDWRKLVRRAGPLGLPLILHILDCTDSAYGNPKSAYIPCDQFEMLTGRTSRAIRGELARLESVGLITRDPMDPWCFTPHPEAFGKAPLLMPERRPTKAERKERARAAAVMAGSQLAAFRSTMASPPTQTQEPPTEIHFRLDDSAHSEIQFRATEIDSRSAETYCPWNWTCPHLSNDIGKDKPLKPFKPEDRESVGRSDSSVVVEASATERPTDRPAPLPLADTPRTPVAVVTAVAVARALESGIDGIRRVVEEVAVPVIGERPTDKEYFEIHRRLNGASPAHYRARLIAKKNAGQLNSIRILRYLADDCADAKDTWKPDKPGTQNSNESDNDRVLNIAEMARAWDEDL